MTIENKISDCIVLQNRFNTLVNPNWTSANYPWYRAIYVESAETADHIGYKWWKNINAPVDREQVLLEFVDIFHFLLSDLMIRRKESASELSKFIANTYIWSTKHSRLGDKNNMLDAIDELIHFASGKMDITKSYCSALVICGFTLEDVVDYYLGKNALNAFRYDHGYKDGTYVKVWDGKEDNVHLDEILKTGERNYQKIYETLLQRYQLFVMKDN